MVKKEVQLKVVEAQQDDAYKGVARIDGEMMRELDIKRGDVIVIKGNRETVAIADRAYPADVGEGIIRIDGILRRNAKTGIGEVVKISKAEVKDAKKIRIAPAQKGMMVQAESGNLRRGLLGRAVVKGDVLVLGGVQRRRDLMSEEFGDMNDIFGNLNDIFGGMGFGQFGGAVTQIKFVVVSANPNQPVIITENTEVELNPTAVEVSDDIGKTIEITYEDIGGLSEEITKIREMVEIPLKHPEIFQRLGIEPPKGVLLHGPPGTGKTLLAKAVASETEANFILLNGPEVMSKFYGESEKKIRDIFEEAEKTAPAIIFIDELDAIAPKREEVMGEVERRVVSQLLTMMDGLKSRGKVIVIGATNRPNSIDPALRRPGRFDREIELNVPGKEGRLSVLKIHSRGMPILGTVYQDIVAEKFKEHISDYLISRNIEKSKIEEKLAELKKSKDKAKENVIDNLISKLDIEKTRIEKLEKIKKLIGTKDTLELLSKELKSIYHTLDLRESPDSRRRFVEQTKSKTENKVSGVLEDVKNLDILEKDIRDINSPFWMKIKEEGKKRDLDITSSVTHGFVGADIEALCKEAAMNVLRKLLPKMKLDAEEQIPQELLEKLVIRHADFMDALKIVRPSAMREVLVETPNVGWKDVGGLDKIKEELHEAVEWPLKYPETFKRMGIRPSRGVLLYGPPGTGKTLLAKAVAKEAEANFIQVKGPSLLSMWVGESEKGMRKVFERARQVSPCIIFFDEIDALAGKRGVDYGTKVTERVLNQLLAEMDGLEDLNDVLVIGATNRPDMLDPAILRPGRFDKVLLIGAPEEEGRLQILSIHTKNMPVAKDVNLHEIAKKTTGYTGADLEALAREAAMIALRESKDAKNVKAEHFEEAMKKIKPSVSKPILEVYKKIEDNLLKSAKTALPLESSYLG